MRSRDLGAAVLCGCILALAAPAADPAKNADGGTMPPGDYTGTLVVLPGTDGAFTLAVESEHAGANPDLDVRDDRRCHVRA